MLINIFIVIFTFFIMEFTAWFAHKYIMHGFLWNLHYDHHNTKKGFFQKNDAFFVIFALPSMASFIIGALYQIDFAYYIGLGILLYGIAYFLVHEVLIHNRFRRMRIFLFNNVNNYYLKTIIYAHRMHHKHIEKEQGESFGMLIVNPQYFKITKEKLNSI